MTRQPMEAIFKQPNKRVRSSISFLRGRDEDDNQDQASSACHVPRCSRPTMSSELHLPESTIVRKFFRAAVYLVLLIGLTLIVTPIGQRWRARACAEHEFMERPGSGESSWNFFNSEIECKHCPLGGVGDRLLWGYWLTESSLDCLSEPGHSGPVGGPFKKCRRGYYSDDIGSVSCKRCPRFSTTASRGSISLADCLSQKGHYFDKDLQLHVPCAKGFFANRLGSLSCKPCSKGSFASTKGSLRCKPCSKGSFAEQTGSSRCTLCAQGSFAVRSEASHCKPCPAHGDTRLKGASSYTKCESIPGYYGPKGGPFKPCPRNTFNDGIGGDCQSCDNSTSFSSLGAARCACLKGHVELQGNNGACRACATGFYKSHLGEGVCKKCPEGTTTESIGATNVSECAATGLVARASRSVWSAGVMIGNVIVDFWHDLSELFASLFQLSWAETFGDSFGDWSWFDRFESWICGHSEPDSSKQQSGNSRACPFGPGDLMRYVKGLPEYRTLKSRSSNRKAKREAWKSLILQLYPDKFVKRFPECDPTVCNVDQVFQSIYQLAPSRK